VQDVALVCPRCVAFSTRYRTDKKFKRCATKAVFTVCEVALHDFADVMNACDRDGGQM
jgi:Leu/Phe-tRNA-protein transferase